MIITVSNQIKPNSSKLQKRIHNLGQAQIGYGLGLPMCNSTQPIDIFTPRTRKYRIQNQENPFSFLPTAKILYGWSTSGSAECTI